MCDLKERARVLVGGYFGEVPFDYTVRLAHHRWPFLFGRRTKAIITNVSFVNEAEGRASRSAVFTVSHDVLL